MTRTDIYKLLKGSDFSIIKNVYFRISLKAFIEYFSDITCRNDYYQEVFNQLQSIADDELDDTSKGNRKENLTLGDMLLIVEKMMRLHNQYDENIPQFIIEKILAEPLAILSKELPSNN